MTINALAPDTLMDGDSLYAGTADGLYLYADWPVAVRHQDQQSKETSMITFTSPVTGELCINLAGNRDLKADLSIFNMQGIRQGRFNNIKTGRSILKHTLTSGIYLARVEIDGEIVTKRVVIY
jgi:hypothetical protein